MVKSTAAAMHRSSPEWEPWPQSFGRRPRNIIVNVLAFVLLAVLSFFFVFSNSVISLPSVVVGDSKADVKSVSDGVGELQPTRTSDSGPEIAAERQEEIDGQGSSEKCDFFTGEWIRNPLGPPYTNETCKFIEPPQNCMTNGRPDREYLYWRWKPDGCDVPQFNAEKFLNAMENKSWALIGDSILRNHAQSLLCLLSKAEEPVETFHDETFKTRTWHFPSHNFTLSLIWSPFLIKSEIFENDDGESKSDNRLHLDKLEEKWTSQYTSFDYIIVSGGQWFLKTAIYLENNTIVGCHYCPKHNLTELGLEYPYGKVLDSLFQFVTSSEHKPLVIYRTWTPDHFENGEWHNGGNCNRSAPYKLGEYDGKGVDKVMRKVELEQFNKALTRDNVNSGTNLMLLDTFQLSLLRPDGHSGPYRTFHPFANGKDSKVQNDCLHWCLPGPIDTWNDIIMELVVNN